MKNLIYLGEDVVDTLKVSFVSSFDKDIIHDIKKPVTIHFFKLVVDGHLIKIQSHDFDTVKGYREDLLAKIKEA